MTTSEPDGTTPLDADEAADLIPNHIATRAELNEWEQVNILEALAWSQTNKGRGTVLSVESIRLLHNKMFGKTWKWAGIYRKSGKNIGVDAHRIPECMHNLIEDAKIWVSSNVQTVDQIAAQFHHRIVSIHPFPNGNGRHGRLVTDLLLQELGAIEFSWGSGSIDREGDVRDRYLAALRRADEGDIGLLMQFVRS